MTAWWVQLGLNFLWSPVFFTLHRPDWALVVIPGDVRRDRYLHRLFPGTGTASRPWLFVPYLAVGGLSATLLNGSIWWLN